MTTLKSRAETEDCTWFEEIFCKNQKPSSTQSQTTLSAKDVKTPLGPMLAISDESHLLLLEFSDCRNFEKEIEQLKYKKNTEIRPGMTDPIRMITHELELYFSGDLKSFQTPFHLFGSAFQKKVWQALEQIPYGQTRSYKHQAKMMGNEKAFRAVANANGANQLAILIPCHRIIQHNGGLGGYGGGIERKKWLLKHEKRHG